MNISFETKILGKSYDYMPMCHSTNDIMLQKVKSGEIEEGHVIVAGHQTNGRGQRGSSWEAEPFKNLTFSLFTKPSIEVNRQYDFNILVSIALKEALSYFTKAILKIKWPNDIYVYDEGKWRKIAGMLLENQMSSLGIKSCVIGIGVNVNQENFEVPLATSLMLVEHKSFDLGVILNRVLLCLEEKYLDQHIYDPDIHRYNYTQNLLFYGEMHRFEDSRGEFEAQLLGVNEEGYLMLNVGGRMEKFGVKDVKYIL